MTNEVSLTRFGVVGCGLMGSGIAEVAARAGLDVMVLEVDAAACERGRDKIASSLARAVRSGKLDESTQDEALARIAFTTDFDELADRQFVVEAVLENEGDKTQVFSMLDKVIED